MPDESDPEPFSNYFNYFTEIEEHFQRARGTGLFLLSPLDWALIETWRNSGVPLEAVLRGIDAAFEKWRTRRSRTQLVNSIAYCTQAVMAEAQRMADAGTEKPRGRTADEDAAPFPEPVLHTYIEKNAAALRATGIPEYAGVADSLSQLIGELPVLVPDPEALELRLSVLEQRLIALARARQPEEQALETRRQLENYVRPWRSKMTAPQISMLETQFMERAVMEDAGLPRLSLFYMR